MSQLKSNKFNKNVYIIFINYVNKKIEKYNILITL